MNFSATSGLLTKVRRAGSGRLVGDGTESRGQGERRAVLEYTSAQAYRWWESNELDDAAGTFTVTKLDGGRFVFNIATGEVVK